jgi:DNA-binding response OmpR family regulator
MSKKHIILIVDDDNDDREIIRDAFMSNHKNHREYVFIENGDNLLNLNMPGKDGREALKEIKNAERFRSIPTIVFTTSASQKDRDTVYSLGANCFITKPDTFNKLVELTTCIMQIWLPEAM